MNILLKWHSVPRMHKILAGFAIVSAFSLWVAASVIPFPQVAHAVSPSTIFSDGFESNNFNSWTGAGSDWKIIHDAPHSGSKAAEVKNSDDDEGELRKNISTSGFEGITLSYPTGTKFLEGLVMRNSSFNGLMGVLGTR